MSAAPDVHPSEEESQAEPDERQHDVDGHEACRAHGGAWPDPDESCHKESPACMTSVSMACLGQLPPGPLIGPGSQQHTNVGKPAGEGVGE